MPGRRPHHTHASYAARTREVRWTVDETGAPGSFGAHLKSLREAAGFTQEELAAIAGLSVHAVGALERGERQRPQFETVRSLSMALDLTGTARDALIASARKSVKAKPGEELNAPPLPLTALVGRAEDVVVLRQWLTDSTIRLITLIGPGGVGKTRLALELARATADEGKTRVVFVSLAAIREVAFVASAIAEALGGGDVPRASCLDAPAPRARATPPCSCWTISSRCWRRQRSSPI